MFPRLYELSIQKDMAVRKMGNWDDGAWRWNLLWRRRLFAWEEELLRNLLTAVNHVVLSENKSDERVWSRVNLRFFSVSNFVLQVNQLKERDSSGEMIGKMAWRNIAPPRAQLHVWILLQRRLNTKERLVRFHTTGIEDDRCTFCREKLETVEHLFFSCKISDSLWCFACDLWNISWCIPREPVACLAAWSGAPFRKCDKQMWISMFYVITWTIWDIRNKIIFHEFQPNWDMERRRLLWRLGSWMRGWCPQLPFHRGHFLTNFNDVRAWAGCWSIKELRQGT